MKGLIREGGTPQAVGIMIQLQFSYQNLGICIMAIIQSVFISVFMSFSHLQSATQIRRCHEVKTMIGLFFVCLFVLVF